MLLAMLLGVTGLLIAGMAPGRTQANFSSARNAGNNVFTTRPDWVPPETSASNVLNSLGNAGVLRQGGAYQVCVGATDSGSPPSGIASVSANMAVPGSVISTGQASLPLTAGNYTCAGTSYNYQSGPLAADSPLGQGSKSFAITGTDRAGNTVSTAWNVTVDNTAPAAIGVQTINRAGGTAGRAEVGDQIILAYNESLHLPSIMSGWNGASAAISVTINNNVAAYGNNDTVTFGVNLGTINLGAGNYTAAPNSVFGASMSWNVQTNTLTVTLTSLNSGRVTTGTPSTATYFPSSAILDLAENGINTSSTPKESGKRHF